MPTPSWRIRHLDALRGLAVTQMICATWLACFRPDLVEPTPLVTGTLGAIALSFLGDAHTGLCLCLLISGFILTRSVGYSSVPTSRLLGARWLKLVGPAIASLLLGTILAALAAAYLPIAAQLTRSPLLASLTPPAASVVAVVDDMFAAIFTGYRDVPILPPIGLAAQAPLLGESFNPALWCLRIQLLASLIVIGLSALRRWNAAAWASVAAAVTVISLPHIMLPALVGHFLATAPGLNRQSTLTGATITLAGFYLCLVPFLAGDVVPREICDYSWIAPACAMPDHLPKCAGALLIFVGLLLSPGLQSLLAGSFFSAIGRVAGPLYLASGPVLLFGGALVMTHGPNGTVARLLPATLAMAIALTAVAGLFMAVDNLFHRAAARLTSPQTVRRLPLVERPRIATARGRPWS